MVLIPYKAYGDLLLAATNIFGVTTLLIPAKSRGVGVIPMHNYEIISYFIKEFLVEMQYQLQ